VLLILPEKYLTQRALRHTKEHEGKNFLLEEIRLQVHKNSLQPILILQGSGIALP
jgi:hypothetical protein